MMSSWEQRYAIPDYLFGTRPSPLLLEQAAHFQPGMQALAVADGEGRNGVWLAEQGLQVTSLDLAPSAVEKARRLAASRGVALQALCADIHTWAWPPNRFDVVTSIFLHLPPNQRQKLHCHMLHSLKPGGLLLLEAYHRQHLQCGAGGPQDAALLYTEAELADSFAVLEVVFNRRCRTPVEQFGQKTQNGWAVQFAGRKKLNP